MRAQCVRQRQSAQREIVSILRDNHHLRSSAEDDFSVRNLTELATAQQQGAQALVNSPAFARERNNGFELGAGIGSIVDDDAQ